MVLRRLCGHKHLQGKPDTQYSGTAYTKPLRQISEQKLIAYSTADILTITEKPTP
jgi:hypothetical protein